MASKLRNKRHLRKNDSLIAAARKLAGESGASAHADNNGTNTGTNFTNLVTVTVTPKRSGIFLVEGETSGSPTVNGLTAGAIQLTEAGSPITDGGQHMIGTDSGGTNTTRVIGGAVSAISARHAPGVPVTFALQGKGTTQGYTDLTSTLTVVEIDG